MIRIPLSVAGDAQAFAAELEAHRTAVEEHMMGKPGVAAPVANDVISFLVQRLPDTGTVADRGPDRIIIAEYEIFDDTPPPALPAEQQQALDVLRETITG